MAVSLTNVVQVTSGWPVAQPDHDPNTQHCLCGADADLIMLGLATHEPNFTIIREEFKPNQARPCEICGQPGHEMKDCIGAERNAEKDEAVFGCEVDFIFVRLCVLREYLEKELEMINLPFKYDFERAIDDWVFMCFFVGNDFLPHLPSLEIREGAIDRLITLYKDCVYKTGGWLTDSGDVNLDRVQLIMLELGKAEDEIFKRRQQNELNYKAREKAKRRRTEGYNDRRPNFNLLNKTQFAPRSVSDSAKPVLNARQEAFDIRRAGMHTSPNARRGLEAMMVPESSRNDNKSDSNFNPYKSEFKGRNESDDQKFRGIKRMLQDDGSDDDQAHDEVRLWEDGFKDRYYESKFDVTADNLEFRYSVALQYVRGLCWVLRYYYQGCASWKWYFPYHYAPFASDFINICGLSTEFESGTKPFRPLEQLMGVFPAASSSHVPKPWAELMQDPESTIIDFYPEDFKIDLNGKKFAWQGVALLPFVDEERLFKALEPYYNLLTPAEIARNIRGDDRLYVGPANQIFGLVHSLYENDISKDQETPIVAQGMRGSVLPAVDYVREGGVLESPVNGLATLEDNNVFCIRYRDPTYPEGYIFSAAKLPGAKLPLRVLKPSDLDPERNKNWRPQLGMVPATQRAYLGQPGHRMLNHHTRPDSGAQQSAAGQYANVPPPMSFNRGRDGGYGRQSYNSNYSSNYSSGYNSGQSSNYSSGHNPPYQGQNSNYSSGYNSGYQQNRGSNYRGGYNTESYQSGNRKPNQSHYNNQRNEARPPGPYRDRYVPGGPRR